MFGMRRFNEMLREAGFDSTREAGKIDYEWIAIKLWLELRNEQKDAEEKQDKTRVEWLQHKLDVIDKYCEKYGTK